MLPRTPQSLLTDLLVRVLQLPARARVLLDGVGARGLSDGLTPLLLGAGRPVVTVHAEGFWRPAGERFTYGREDAEHFRTGWLDDRALVREVLTSGASALPALRDVGTDRSARQVAVNVPETGVVLVDGLFLVGLPADLTVHVSLSPAALGRRGVPGWQHEAFRVYDELVRPGDVADVLVRAEDPERPAVRVR